MVLVTKHKAEEELVSNFVPGADGNDKLDSNSKEAEEAAGTSAEAVGDLIVTPSCWDRIRQLAAKKDLALEDVYLRVYVDAGGCSGFTYKFEMDVEAEEPIEDGDDGEDVVFRGPDGARVVVDESSLELIRGSTIDYVQEMIKSAFEVRDNPLSESACGCGSSFALKNFAANPAID